MNSIKDELFKLRRETLFSYPQTIGSVNAPMRFAGRLTMQKRKIGMMHGQ